MKQLLVYGEKTFKLTVPDDVTITFGPFSPPTKGPRDFSEHHNREGTLRVYRGKSKSDIIAVFAGVRGFRDLSLGYAEEVAREEGATIWKSDEKGYHREDKNTVARAWVEAELPALPPARRKRR